MKRILLSLLLFCLPLAVFADGMVIPSVAYPAKVTIPDQRALICFSNGVERLVIETRFTGAGTNFAWIVPLPSQPVIEEATTGLFTTLEHIFRPTIIHDVIPWYAILLSCVGVVYLVVSVRRNTPFRMSDMLVAVSVALAIIPLEACAGIPLIILLPYIIWRVRQGRESPWLVIVVLLLVFVMSAMLLPALGTASVAVSESEVSVLKRETVGIYDTTTIAAKTSDAIINWFHENGYAYPPAADNVISNYISRGWVFAAIKLRRELAQGNFSSPQPLSFSFPVTEPVYPMQLTGIQSTNLTVELFVFGRSRANAEDFRAVRCAAPAFPDASEFSRGSTKEIRVLHPLLRKWANGLPVATKLTANLTPQTMTQDTKIHWLPFTEIRDAVYSLQGAGISALNCGAVIFVFGLLFASIAVIFKPNWKDHLNLTVALAAIAGLVAAGIFFAAIPKADVRLEKLPVLRSIMNLRYLASEFATANQTNHFYSPGEARAAIERIQNDMTDTAQTNFLLGGLIHEEDSPGNYILRQNTNGIEFVAFDADGGEHVFDR